MAKAPKPVGKYRSRDLAQAAGASLRMIRFYVENDLLPPPLTRGTGPVYTEEHLLRLRAIRALRAQKMSLRRILAWLRKASNDEIAAAGARAVPSAPAAPAAPTSAPTSEDTKSTSHAPEAATRASLPSQRWERIELLPGLELHVRADGGPLLARLAEEIHARYGVRS